MSSVSDVTKQELIQHSGMPHSIVAQQQQQQQQSAVGSVVVGVGTGVAGGTVAGGGTTGGHSRSKPQACKVCGKMLSSASSYYVHMKLHSGTKPFQCTVSTCLPREKYECYFATHIHIFGEINYPLFTSKDPIFNTNAAHSLKFAC